MCQLAKQQSLGIPPSAVSLCAEGTKDKEPALTKQLFDDVAQALCLLCQEAEKKSVPMPPAVAAWWAEHKTMDARADDDLAKGLAPTPTCASFWDEHAAKESVSTQVTGINHLDAIRALEKAGYQVVRQGREVVLANGTRQILIPRDDPVNGFAMATIIKLAGLTEEEFRKLL
jgi:hypothetical protein